MELWDEDYFNMEVHAYIHLHENGSGNFQFGLVTGQMEGKTVKGKGEERYEFTWDGFDEGDRICGTGWINLLKEDEVEGEIRIHLGDRSKFRARKTKQM